MRCTVGFVIIFFSSWRLVVLCTVITKQGQIQTNQQKMMINQETSSTVICGILSRWSGLCMKERVWPSSIVVLVVTSQYMGPRSQILDRSMMVIDCADANKKFSIEREGSLRRHDFVTLDLLRPEDSRVTLTHDWIYL